MMETLGTIDDVARAFHCPTWIATKVYFRDDQAYRNIRKVGPMRVHWKACHGWHLDNRPISIDDLAKLHMSWA